MLPQFSDNPRHLHPELNAYISSIPAPSCAPERLETLDETDTYDLRSRQIASEMKYIAAKVEICSGNIASLIQLR